MMVFRIQPHRRLHEWVADEAGFFRDEGLEYEFDPDRYAAGSAMTSAIAPAGEVHGQIRSGAFEDMAKGRSSDVSCACHWAVNAAAAAHHGRRRCRIARLVCGGGRVRLSFHQRGLGLGGAGSNECGPGGLHAVFLGPVRAQHQAIYAAADSGVPSFAQSEPS
jgi:hypothetical protein